MPTLPIAGSLRGTVLRVGAVSIHGDIYFDLLIAPEPAPSDVQAGSGVSPSSGASAPPASPPPPTPGGPPPVPAIGLRVPSHATPGGHVPDEGERVEVQFLMGQVTSVRGLGL